MIIKSVDFTDKDNEITGLFQKGNKKAFEQLYDQFAPLLLSIICRIVKDRKIAEIALSRAFMQIWKNKKSYCAQKGCIIVWLIQFAREAAFSLMEKMEDGDKLIDAPFDNKEYCSLELMDLMLVYGKSPAEICQLLNISPDTFATKLKSAIQISHTKI